MAWLRLVQAAQRPLLAAQVDDGRGHRGAGLDRLGVGLEVTLRGDQVDQLLRQVHVGAFCRTGAQGTETGRSRVTQCGLARSR